MPDKKSSRKRETQIRRQIIRNVRAIFASYFEKMTPEQTQTLQELRAKVKNKEITVKQAQEIWAKKYGDIWAEKHESGGR